MLTKQDAYHVIWDHPGSAEFIGILRPSNGFLYLDTWGRGSRALNWNTPPTHLHGYTSDGYHLSAFGLTIDSRRQCERGEAIRYYDDVISIERCYAGNDHIVDPDPIINQLYVQSDDFEPLSILLQAKKEEQSILLFENDFVRIDFSVGESWSGSIMETSTKTELGLRFTLSEGVDYDANY